METGEILYVDSSDGLQRLCESLAGAAWLAVDTEFQRERTYYPTLCLLQLATSERVACIDTMEKTDLQPLLTLLYDPGITKVMHAAGQDLEILYHLCGRVPRPVFDTQLAAPLLGYSAQQIGYADLVSRMLGVQLAKAHTRTDWTQRPLSRAQLQYAADDVRYLAVLYPRMRQSLVKSGRLDWLDEDFELLTDPVRYSAPPDEAWRRLRGAARMRGNKLSVVQALAAWRESAARAEDTPRNWLMRDDLLLEVAKRLPDSRQALGAIKGLKRRVIKQYSDRLLALVNEARERPPRDAGYPRQPALNGEQAALADELWDIVVQRAEGESLDSSLLAGRRELARLAAGERDLPVLRGWRRRMVGDELLARVDGT